jgi:hypothetical protein
MKKRFEILLIQIARKLLDRNVERAMFISRKDNNYLFEVEHILDQIIHNMKTDYKR